MSISHRHRIHFGLEVETDDIHTDVVCVGRGTRDVSSISN